MNETTTRRRLLRAAGTAAAMGVAGCTDDGQSDPDPPDVSGQTRIEPIDPDAVEELDEAAVTADGYPSATLNWAHHFAELVPNGPYPLGESRVPQRMLDLNVVSVVVDQTPPAYYEEYQTAAAASARLDLENGEPIELAGNETPSVVSTIEFDEYPNKWYLLEDDRSVYALSRAGGLVAGGSLDKKTYLNPRETLIDQLRTRTPPDEGSGMAVHPLETLLAFDRKWGHTSLDLDANDAAAVPMDEFSAARAGKVVESWYDDSLYEADKFQIRETDVEGYPVDAYESYSVTSNTFETNFDVRVTSWVSTEYATEFARELLAGTEWTYDPDTRVHEDDDEAAFGPYSGHDDYPNCGVVSEDGIYKLRKRTTAPHRTYPTTYDVFSGNVTMVRF